MNRNRQSVPATLLLWWLACGLSIGLAHAGPLLVDSDFEGGSVRVTGIDHERRVIDYTPGGDPRRGWPCWWYFRINGITPGETITLRLSGSPAALGIPGAPMQKPLAPAWAMPHYATTSHDGRTWSHTERGVRQDSRMTYRITPEQSSIYVAWGPPYTPADATRFVQAAGRTSPHARSVELCRSREGRAVPLLHVQEGPRPRNQRFAIWVQARQHAWECGSSWVAQGFMEWTLGQTAEAAWLRQHAEIFIVPVMDVDHTATGDGGKEAPPHDHNRDWSPEPYWIEVRAAQKKIRGLISEGRMDVFLDLHNPAPGDPTFFYVTDQSLLVEPMITLRDRFIDLAYGRISRIEPMIPMSSKTKVTGIGYHPRWQHISSNWVGINGNPHTVSLCLETIWNSAHSTTTGYRAVGAGLAASVHDYLAERHATRK